MIQSLKDEFIANLRDSKLVFSPEINGLTLTYEQRRGLETLEGCKLIQKGLMIVLQNAFKGYVNLHFEEVDKSSRKYRATLQVLGETGEEEKQLAYDALTKINNFIHGYRELKKR
jgi:hypothetical protein